LVAPVGTVATIEVAPQLAIVDAVVPLKVTELVPCVVPKFVPVIVTDAPTAPEVGDRLVMFGAAKEALADATHKTMRAKSCHFLFTIWAFFSLE